MIRFPLEECWRLTGQGPINTRSVDANKTNTEAETKHRSRPAAREMLTDERLDLCAGKPPRTGDAKDAGDPGGKGAEQQRAVEQGVLRGQRKEDTKGSDDVLGSLQGIL